MVHSILVAMKRNLTVQLDDDVIRRAKVLAAKRGTSVSGLVAAELDRLVAEDERYEEAWTHCADALRLLHGCGALVNIPQALNQMAALAAVWREWQRTARLLGTAEALRESMGLPMETETARTEAECATRTALGQEAFSTAYAEGEAMALDEAIAYALVTS